MKKILVLFFVSLVCFTQNSYSQNVRDFVEGKYFKNQQTGRSIKFGYITSLNTNVLTFKDSEGNIAYFMNCSIDMSRDEQYMVLTNCMSNVTGGTLGKIVVNKDRLIWNGSEGSLTFYLESQSTYSENNVVNSFFLARNVIYPIKGFPAYYYLFADGELYFSKINWKSITFGEYKSAVIKPREGNFTYGVGFGLDKEYATTTYIKCIPTK